MTKLSIEELRKKVSELEKEVELLKEERLQQDKIIISYKQIEHINADMHLVNRAISDEKDLHKMLGKVMDAVLDIFNCDRAWLLYPADPNIDKYQIPIMKTSKEWYIPEGLELKIDKEAQFVINEALKTKNSVDFYSSKPLKLPENIIKEQGVKSQLIQIINPNIGKKWIFGIHQCSYERIWKDNEKELFEKITARIIESLNSLLYYRDMLGSEKKLEQHIRQAQKMESIGALAGGIAHDFNNLLTVINGYSEIALMNLETSNPLYSKIELILSTGKRAEDLTRQLLAFSRKQIYKAEITDVNQVISSLYKMLSRLIGEDIDAETVFFDKLPNIKADKSQLEQIFVNLIINARDALFTIKKTEFQKKITIETGIANLDAEYVARNPGSREGLHIFFAVSDNGIGMDEITLEKVFEPFFTTKKKGTGLGLSTVYGIVKQNNGSIYAYSEPEKGTMFKIYWPVTDETIIKKQKISSKILQGNERILIVEDDKAVCRFAQESLSSFGYNVFTAENGRLALDLIKRESLDPDLIVTDLIMPELNGKEFIDKVKVIYKNVKVIFVSGYTDNHIVHNGLLEKEINFVQKPYSYKTLVTAVRKVLDE